MQNQREEALEPPGLACNGLTLGYDGRPVIEGLDLSLPPGDLACHRRRVRLREVDASHRSCGAEAFDFGERSGGPPPQGGVRSIQDMRTSFVWQHLGLFAVEAREGEPRASTGAFRRTLRRFGRTCLGHAFRTQLSGLESRFPSELSGGQRQRLALGRALIVQPQVLFMDEPFSALDALLRARMQDFLTALRRRHPCSVILVTHDIGEAVALGSHVLMLAPQRPQSARML